MKRDHCTLRATANVHSASNNHKLITRFHHNQLGGVESLLSS